MKESNNVNNYHSKKWAELVPLDISPAAFLAAFGPGPYRLRSFCDQGSGPGQNYTVTAAELADPDGLLGQRLRAANDRDRRGIFFVVNPGGHKDAEITGVAAQFVEADDLPLATQWDNLMAFPLPPSIVVRTRKSLHGYWLMPGRDDRRETLLDPAAAATATQLAQFRLLQKGLAAHFCGDPAIVNPSRVMRLPGFDHHKAEPVAVVCLVFEPARRYSQAQLAAALAGLAPDPPTGPATGAKSRQPTGVSPPDRDSRLILKNCDFIRYCRDHAVNLREPLWYAMITNLVGTRGGTAAIHQLSQPDPRYDPTATDAKIAQAGKSATGPISCQTIRDWGYACPRLGSCPAKCPQSLGQLPLPPWYEKQSRGLRLKPGVLADYLSRDKQLIYAGEAYYQFSGGVYRMVDENHVKRLIRKQLRVDHVTMAQIKDVLGQLTLLWVAQELLLGRANVSNVPWQSLDDRFKTAELVGKLANIFADLPSKNIEDNGLFKSITGEDRITAERKNRDPFSFVATARLVFSCNAIPKNLGDRSAAFYRRLVIVPFLPARPAAQRDPKLREAFVAETPGIFNWALAGLTRLIANDYRFSELPESAAALANYRIEGSSVLSFVADCCRVDPGVQSSSTQIYHAYSQYCQDSGLRPVSQKRFGTELEGEYQGVKRDRDTVTRRTIYQGIGLDMTESHP
jgi:phage/plasmid primase, P4 family, C-terminal domain